MRLFQITNKSFFEKVADYVSARHKEYIKDPKKFPKAHIPEAFYKMFTIKQLDTLSKACSCTIEEVDTNFVSAYFSKVFSNELSKEN